MADRELQEFIDNSNSLLDKIEKEMKNNQYSEDVLTQAMKTIHLLADKIFVVSNDKNYRHQIPDELNDRIEKIMNLISMKGIGHDINDWHVLIANFIKSFIKHYDVPTIKKDLELDITDNLETRKTAIRYIKSIWEMINEYEAKFKSTFDPTLKDQLNKKIKEIEKGLGLYLKEDDRKVAPVNIKSVDSDAVLDLYEEIKNMPESDERQQKIRELERLQNILKSSDGSKILLSFREKIAGPTLDKPYFDFALYEEKAKRMSDAELRGAIRDIARTLATIQRDPESWPANTAGWYADEKFTYMKELNLRNKR